MAAVTRPALVVPAARERAYLSARHGLHPAGEPLSIEQLAGAHAGLHAARLPTPFVTLRTRLPGFAATQLRAALAPGGGLVKLRTCRRTLHIYPLAHAPAAHAATARQRLGACAAATRRLGYDPMVLTRLTPLVRESLSGGALPHRELERRVLAASPPVRVRRDARTELVRLTIKLLWESGELCYRNTADSLHHERREFDLTRVAFPSLLLDRADPAEAIQLLLRRYLTAFGPASIEDFQWWSGLTRRETTTAVAALASELIDVRVDGYPHPLVMLAEDETDLRTVALLAHDHIALLAYEDPALKGYFTTRHRYVDERHRDVLFNTIGEVRASITVAGRCVGTWQFNKATRTTGYRLYSPTPSSLRRVITRELDAMTEFLRSEPS